MPERDPWVVFGLPGQPNYRYFLGMTFRPIRVQFENFTLDARRPAELRMIEIEVGKGGNENYSSILDDLIPLEKRFRNAEYAVRRGLPPDEFEHTD
jgi:hypothetical protein